MQNTTISINFPRFSSKIVVYNYYFSAWPLENDPTPTPDGVGSDFFVELVSGSNSLAALKFSGRLEHGNPKY